MYPIKYLIEHPLRPVDVHCMQNRYWMEPQFTLPETIRNFNSQSSLFNFKTKP